MKNYIKYTIALTGGICSGKSTVANAFANLNVYIIDCDIIAREIVSPGTNALNKIIIRYGDKILNKNKTLFRHRLRDIIFTDDTERNWLNNLLHPLIKKRLQELKTQVPLKYHYILLVIPLLVEKEIYNQSNRILVIDAHESTQLKRIQKRDQISIVTSKRILKCQASRNQRLNIADDIINNNDENIKKLLEQVKKLHIKYLKLSQTNNFNFFKQN